MPCKKLFWRDAAVYLTTALSRFDIAQNFDPRCMLSTLHQPITRNPFRSLVDKGLVEGIQAADRSLPKSMKILRVLLSSDIMAALRLKSFFFFFLFRRDFADLSSFFRHPFFSLELNFVNSICTEKAY